jgi:hypothetical protein
MESTKSGGMGRCQSGAVRYRYEGEPPSVGLCQCERCQRQSDSAFLIGVIFPGRQWRLKESWLPVSRS